MYVDRIEEGIAVLIGDDGERLELPLESLPEGTREGSLLRQTPCGFEPDPGEAERRRLMAERTRRLIRKRRD